jgi:hypothetical protein
MHIFVILLETIYNFYRINPETHIMKKLLGLFSKKDDKKKEIKTNNNNSQYRVEHSIMEWQGKLNPSEKVDIDLLQDVIDRLLEDKDGKYLEELNELNKKHSVKIIKHKKEARMHKNDNLHKQKISKSIIPC